MDRWTRASPRNLRLPNSTTVPALGDARLLSVHVADSSNNINPTKRPNRGSSQKPPRPHPIPITSQAQIPAGRSQHDLTGPSRCALADGHFQEEPGSYDICPICFWEDDISQLRFPTLGGGANRVSLVEAQLALERDGAIEPRFLGHIRPVRADDRRDPGWRLIDPSSDHLEVPQPGVDYSADYRSDSTTYYYWRAG